MKLNNILILGALVATMGACSSDAPEVELSVSADKTEVAVGEPVTLTITHEVQGLTVFSGDAGHDYYKSAAYVLNGKTEQEIRETVFRESDPGVVPMEIDFSNDEPGAAEISGGAVEVVNTGGGSLMNSEAMLVNDEVTGGKALMIVSTHPDWWYQALRINLNTRLGANQTLTLTMRFNKDYLSDTYTLEPHPEVADFCTVIRLAGKGKGSDEIVFSDNTVWDIYWAPTLTPTDYSVDLSRIIEVWQSSTGLEMEELSYVQILFTSTGSVGFVGDIYIEKIQYGSLDYFPFDTGEGLTLGSGPGTVTYTHAFDAPGEYEMVVMGTNTSWKNYSGNGYNTDPADKISADEYNYDRKIRTVKIKVK